jgi:uncharacterized protein
LTITIEIRELGEILLRGGVLIDCISGPHHENLRVGRYLIEQLNMEQIAVIESDSFPVISTVYKSKPHFPMRVYANQSSKISVIISDFTPNQVVTRSLGKSLISWAKNKSIALIITSYQVPTHELRSDVGAACSTTNARLRVEQSRIDQIDFVRLAGLPAVLLNEGNWMGMDVIALVLQASTSTRKEPTVAERIVQGIDVLLPEIKFDMGKLYATSQAERPPHLDQKSSSNVQEQS